MVPFFALLVVTAVSAGIGVVAARRTGEPGKGWQRPLSHGMAVMFLVAALGHFIEPLRSGLIATVPPIIPLPDVVITATGLVEIVLAAALLVPASRRLAASATVLYLLAVFPANVLAATSVDHADAPSTPLLLRAAIQVVFVAAAVVIARTGEGRGLRDALRMLGSRRHSGAPRA